MEEAKPNEEMSLPTLNVNISQPEQKESELIKSEQLVGYYTEILDDIRDDRREIDEVLRNFLEMVTNEGDSTSSSKELVGNLLKLKAETSDKKTKVLDLLMRAYLKEKDTFPRYLNASQTNQITFSGNKRKLLKSLEENQGESQ